MSKRDPIAHWDMGEGPLISPTETLGHNFSSHGGHAISLQNLVIHGFSHLAGQHQWDPNFFARCTHSRTYFSGWIGMFTGPTGVLSAAPGFLSASQAKTPACAAGSGCWPARMPRGCAECRIRLKRRWGAAENGCGGENRFGIPFWLVGEVTTHFRTCFSGWIGMLTGGTIWILSHAWPNGNPETKKSLF